jgi:hypothetical protein
LIFGLDFPILNKFEKEKMVIQLHKEGKTIKEIAIQVHKNFRDISRIIKKYERKKELQTKSEASIQSTQTKNTFKSTQAFKLFSDGKKLTDVAIDLEISARKAVKFWSQFLKLERMYECYEFYQVFQYDIPRLLSINKFIKENNINIHNIETILKQAKDISGLQLEQSILKYEIAILKQNKNNYSLNQNTNHHQQLLPLGLPKHYYE